LSRVWCPCAADEVTAAERVRISPLRLFLTLVMLHSGANGGPVEVVLPWWSLCTGVARRRLIVLDLEGM
jgi:DMSO/TMAO reductase YedYZ molybdopterin-dependent catalytic subunit